MTDDQLQQEFLQELLRQQEQADRSAAVFGAAEELYAPAALGPATAPAPTPAPAKIAPFLDRFKPDRLVTYPIWILVNVALFGSLALLMLAALMFGTAILMMLGAAIDSVIGMPLARVGAVGIGVLAGVGTFAQLYRSFLERVRSCPW